MVQYAEYSAPFGTLLLEAEGEKLVGLWMNRSVQELCFPSEKRTQSPVLWDGKGVLADAVAWLDGYFRGEVRQIAFPLAPKGTAFQKLVWQRLLEIPYGETVSYGAIAREIGEALGKEQMSAQAVGQAVGKNPIGIIIPCHRVVGAKGQLTGYAGGIDKKIWLLNHEGWKGETK